MCWVPARTAACIKQNLQNFDNLIKPYLTSLKYRPDFRLYATAPVSSHESVSTIPNHARSKIFGGEIHMHSKTTSLTPLLALALMLAGLNTSASAQTYTSFDALPNGTFPSEMDSSGRIVGRAVETGQPGLVFVRETDGTITLTTAPASDWVGFSGSDDIVGRYQDTNYIEHGYVGPIAGPFTTFDVEGSTGTYPSKANASGEIAGFWTDASNKLHGSVRSASGTITKFDVPGAVTTQPEAINSSGQVAGLTTDSKGVLHGFIGTPGGKFATFNFPSGTASGLAKMNDAGQVAGYYADSNFNAHAYLRNPNGTFTTLNESGQVTASAINQGGFIVGVFGGKYHGRKDGFMWRPDGTSATIEFPGADTINSSTKPADINQTGIILGNYQLTTTSGGDTVWHGFVVTGVH